MKKKIGVIGFGNMAEAIIAGIIKKKLVSSSQIQFIEKSVKRAKSIEKRYKIKSVSWEKINDCQIILLAVKPQNIADVLPQLKSLNKNSLLISIVTGVKLNTYRKILGTRAKVIRVMPNTPALIGKGAAAYYATSTCSRSDKKSCLDIFSAVGIITEMKSEKLLDAVTAISGSGPAFVYEYAKAMIAAAKKHGLSESASRSLVLQTLSGATEMMNQHADIDDLQKRVTSKGGTTAAGLATLKKKGFTKTIEACMKAAHKRAVALSKE